MSKSYNNVIGLFDKKDTLAKKVMSIVTDSRGPSEPKDPDKCNVFYFHNLVSKDKKALRKRYLDGSISYKESKELLIDSLDSFIAPFRERKEELDKDTHYVLKVLSDGKEKAFGQAQSKMAIVKSKIGVML